MTQAPCNALEELRRRNPVPAEELAEGLAQRRTELLAAVLSTPRRPPHRRARTWMAGFAGAAAVALVGAVAQYSMRAPEPPAPNRPQLPAEAPEGWRLLAALQGPQFELSSSALSQVAGVHCTTSSTCFLTTEYGLDYDQGGSMYLSSDGGRTWAPVPLPPHEAATTLISCATPDWCAVGGGLFDTSTGDALGGKFARDPELLVTSDGGRSWSAVAVPVPVNNEFIPATGQYPAETGKQPGAVLAVQCSAPGACALVGQSWDPDSHQGGRELWFFRTTDGGAHWTSSRLTKTPADDAEFVISVSLNCPTAQGCVVAGILEPLAGPEAGQIAATWHTTDGGATWQEHRLPAIDAGQSPIDCPTLTTCWALGSSKDSPGSYKDSPALRRSEDGGTTWNDVALPPQSAGSTSPTSWDAASCPSASNCWLLGYGIAAETQDGGAHWQESPLPAPSGDVSVPRQLSCTSDQLCAAIAVPAHAPTGAASTGSLVLVKAPAPQPVRTSSETPLKRG